LANPKDQIPSRATRLLQAAESARARRETRSEARPKPDIPRLIRFPKDSGALRQHVTETRRQAPEKPTATLKTPLLKLKDPLVRAPRATQEVPSALLAYSGSPQASRISSAGDLGRLVRARRIGLRLSQQQLAAAAGVGRRFLVELEAGKPTAELAKVLAVCAAVGMSLLAEAETGA
jgi:y4mF family transcriptional regulator